MRQHRLRARKKLAVGHRVCLLGHRRPGAGVGESEVSEEKPKREDCPNCRLFTYLIYADGWARCQNPGCKFHASERVKDDPGSAGLA